VLNTWFEPPVNPVGTHPAALQQRLCKPSLGNSWNADRFAAVCGLTNGVTGSTVIAAGQTLRTRFAVANYSTDDADVEASIYFSSDDTWDALDVASATTHTFTVNKSVSSQQGRTWTVPALPPGEYYVIARGEATLPLGRCAHRLDSPARHCDGELNRTRQHSKGLLHNGCSVNLHPC
jgi:hypothetical protein